MVEQTFLFEQATDSVMCRRFPADDGTLEMLSALRMQYVVGDYEDGAYICLRRGPGPSRATQMERPHKRTRRSGGARMSK